MTDKELAQAAMEVELAIAEQLPAPDDCHHEFSPAFYRKMHDLIPAIDPETGEIRKSGRIWDEDTERYI